MWHRRYTYRDKLRRQLYRKEYRSAFSPESVRQPAAPASSTGAFFGGYPMRLFVLAAVAATAVALPAAAQTSDHQISASAGYSRFADGTEGFDGSSFTARLGARLHENFGIEGEASFGLVESDIAGYDFKMTHNIAGYVAGYWPASDQVEFIARLGVTTTEFDVSGFKDSYTGVAAGVGGQYNFDEHNGLRMDVTHYQYSELDAGMDSVSIMYVRTF
jgi:outer membrane immunogenic protein